MTRDDKHNTALLGMVVSRKLIAVKVGMLAVLIFAMSYVMLSLGEQIRFRYFLPLCLPVFVLAFGWIGERLELRWKALPFWGLSGFLVCGMLFDCLAFFHQWSRVLTSKEGTPRTGLPAPPNSYIHRYRVMSGTVHSDHSTPGAYSLFQLGTSSPSQGAAIVLLRDERQQHPHHAGSATRGAAWRWWGSDYLTACRAPPRE